MLDSGVYLCETHRVIPVTEDRTKESRDRLKANLKEERGNLERKRRGNSRQREVIKSEIHGAYALGRALRP